MVAARATRQGREIGKASVEKSFRLERDHRTHARFFERGHAIGHMRPVKVDPIGFKPLETRLDGRDHRLAAVAGDENASLGSVPKLNFVASTKSSRPPARKSLKVSSDCPN